MYCGLSSLQFSIHPTACESKDNSRPDSLLYINSAQKSKSRSEPIIYRIDHPKRLQRRRQKNIEQRQRHQKPPAKVHQLIKAKARQRASQPDIEKQKPDYLAEKIEDTQPRQLLDEWPIPTAEKQCRRQHR